MGIGGALMWPAILGMTFAALPEERAGLAGGLILGAAGIGNAAGPLIGGALTDLLELALDLLPQPPGDGVRRLRHLREIHQPQPRGRGHADRLRGASSRSRSAWSRCCSPSTRCIDWGWGDPRIIGLLALFVVADRHLRVRSSGRRASTRWSRRT